MPGDVSSSSSSSSGDDEAQGPAQGPGRGPAPGAAPKEARKTTSRFQCPADFVSMCHRPCSGTLSRSLSAGGSDTELWLIKAPANFNPECLSGIKMNLSGLQTLKVPPAGDGVPHIYSILASSGATSELRLLTRAKQSSDAMVFGPPFSGLLNVCESYGGGANHAPQVIPAAPAPVIPPGLKQRFQPFGSKTPTATCMAESEADGATHRPLVEEEEEQGRKKRKKKKKEKRMKMEQMEEKEVKTEVVTEHDEVMTELASFQQGDFPEKKKKKKKRKKEDSEEEVVVKQEEVTVKCEPMDTSYGDVAEKKKKKKKKKSQTEES